MLVISRKLNESVCIGEGIEVQIVALRPGMVRLGIIAPKEIPFVGRKEILEQLRSRARTSSPTARGIRPSPSTGQDYSYEVEHAYEKNYDELDEPIGRQERLEPPKRETFEEQAERLERRSHEFRQQLAAELTPTLNAKIQAMPHETYEEKKNLAKWVNEELRRFDLAIKCPKTGEPSILLADVGNKPEFGRFIIEHKNDDGKRVRSFTSAELPHLELIEANPRREAIVEWREKTRQTRKGPERT